MIYNDHTEPLFLQSYPPCTLAVPGPTRVVKDFPFLRFGVAKV